MSTPTIVLATPSKTIKDILTNARAVRARGVLKPDTKLGVVVLVDRIGDGFPDVLNQLSEFAGDELNINGILAEPAALNLERVRGETLLAVINHMTSPLDTLPEQIRIAIANATVTAQVALDVKLEDLLY